MICPNCVVNKAIYSEFVYICLVQFCSKLNQQMMIQILLIPPVGYFKIESDKLKSVEAFKNFDNSFMPNS